MPIKFNLDPSACTPRHVYVTPSGSDVLGSSSLCTVNDTPVHGYEEGPAFCFVFCENRRLLSRLGWREGSEGREELAGRRKVLSEESIWMDKRVEDDWMNWKE